MKNKLHPGLILGMIFIYANTFGQPNGTGSEEIKDDKALEIHSSLFLNSVSAILNYGESSSALLIDNEIVTGRTSWNGILDWCYNKILNFIQIIFHLESRDGRHK